MPTPTLRVQQAWIPVAAACIAALVAIGAPALVSTVGSSNGSTKADPPTSGPTVLVEPMGFTPETIVIRSGQSVTFQVTRGDQPDPNTPHQITSSVFVCPPASSISCSHTFTATGTYHFVDALSHTSSVGTVIVRPG